MSKNFLSRHIGPNEDETKLMLQTIGVNSLDELIDQTVPQSIRRNTDLKIGEALTEQEYLELARTISLKNKIFKSYIGMGYYNTFVPPVIQRGLFENAGWYTQYTPYQAEIAQGRLESLLNFQTMISDLTGLEVCNASLLDEGTAAAEAMAMLFHNRDKNSENKNICWVSTKLFPQTIDVLMVRAKPLGIQLWVSDNMPDDENVFAAVFQYADCNGAITDYSNTILNCKSRGIKTVMCCDLLALTLLKSAGEIGVDVAVGSAQRFGVPMGFGGPHAAFFATKDEYKRMMPGRIIGVSIDAKGKPAYRMALQTREQHIRREKATSNICTAQALLANMAAMFAVYHGPAGLKEIATRTHKLAMILSSALEQLGFKQLNEVYFDTICVKQGKHAEGIMDRIHRIAEEAEMNFNPIDSKTISISLDETTSEKDVQNIISVFAKAANISNQKISVGNTISVIPESLQRTSEFLTHSVFHSHHSESQMMRYLKQLENKDLSLAHSMISLGSCTMKLNAAAEMFPVSYPGFSAIHPFAPANQTEGYLEIISELENMLCDITGFSACSLQPNSGAQGEYAGLMVIMKYLESKGESHRNVVLIPSSAHGTNPASAVMAGMKVVVIKCDEKGNIDLSDLKIRAEEHAKDLACLMVTYPSTHGVFEETIIEACQIIHNNGGQVYMDGANMNAQVGITSPYAIGADVNHINLHKTFAIPHGGGGPGMGPICVASHLKPFLPGHAVVKIGSENSIHAVSAAPWGSASILLISYGYIKMLGSQGCTDATRYAILNANYMKAKLEKHFSILYTGSNNRCAHEMIVDMREFKKVGVEVEDIAKRLMDYGFHAPTVSFPVPGTLMIEPTESEDKAEIDRFCQALISIREEIREVAYGTADKENNVLKNAPHTQEVALADDWNYPYSRTKAVYPLSFVKQNKFWPSVSRINNTHGDRNLICTCPAIEEYVNG